MRKGGFDIAPSPRRVPGSVRLGVLFGGWLNQVGWGLVAFGGIFALIFAVNADCTSWYHFRGEIQSVTGTVTGVERTAFSQGGGGGRHRRSRSSGRGKPIYEVRYRYTPTADISREGVSYLLAPNSTTEPTVPQEVIVEYPANRPDVSRIRGMRRRPFHGALALIGLLPVSGLFMALLGLRRGMHKSSLLKCGKPANARLVDKRATGAQVNKQTVWALTFEYVTDQGTTLQTVVRTHHEERLLDEATEKLVYDPGHPTRAVLLDSLPGTPGLDEMGNIRPSGTGPVVALLILPAVGTGMLAAVMAVMAR